MAIKHISFDLWLTLIKSHPEFKQKRSELIADFFNIKQLSATEINLFIRSVDKIFDRYNEISGKKVSADIMYYKVLQKILPDSDFVKPDCAKELRKAADNLFLEYPPLLLNENIINILSQLKEDGYSLNISSNTGFIEGKILRTVLTNMDILQHFDFYIFSDEIEASKPSSYFFEKVYEHLDIDKKEVLHVGDNPKSDYKGAKSFGFDALLITNPNYTIDDIRTKL